MDKAAQPLPFVSIVVLNYNGADLLPGCLDSLLNIAYTPHEVIVVENGSTDDSLQVLARYPWVKIVRTERNLGVSGGYSLALPESRGEFILVMNNDLIANRDFVSALSQYLVDHPEVGIVQAKMVLPRHNGVLDVCGTFLTRFGFPYLYGYFKPDGPKYQRSYPVFCAKGACMMFRRKVIDEAGGYFFNPDFHCYYEETDLCHRAWLAGYETHFVASPPIQHLHGVTLARTASVGFIHYHYLRNMTFSLLTNLGSVSLLKIMPLYFAAFFASMLAEALRWRWNLVFARCKALVYNLRNLKKILKQRRLTQRIRKMTDQQIFAKTMRNPRLEYFLKTFSGGLAKYID